MNERLGHVHFVNADLDRALRARTRPGRTSQKTRRDRPMSGFGRLHGRWHDHRNGRLP